MVETLFDAVSKNSQEKRANSSQSGSGSDTDSASSAGEEHPDPQKKQCFKESGLEAENKKSERPLNVGEFITYNEVLNMDTICELRKVDTTKPTNIRHVGLKKCNHRPTLRSQTARKPITCPCHAYLEHTTHTDKEYKAEAKRKQTEVEGHRTRRNIIIYFSF